MRFLPALAAIAILAACSREHQRFVPNASDGAHTPSMATRDVSTLISDSGYTRYHLTAPLWEMFENAEEPFWKFPEGLEVEQYDLAMNPESTVVCDSATYFSRKRIWQLDGNVVMVNTQADSFLTQQLFWDQAERKIYSDSFVHIVRSDRTIEGYGFVSDQSMLYYTVNRPTAILPARRPGSAPRSERPDSAQTATATPSDSLTPTIPKPLPARPQAPRPRKAPSSNLQKSNLRPAVSERIKE